MNQDFLTESLDAVVTLARQAGNAIMECYSESATDVSWKKDGLFRFADIL